MAAETGGARERVAAGQMATMAAQVVTGAPGAATGVVVEAAGAAEEQKAAAPWARGMSRGEVRGRACSTIKVGYPRATAGRSLQPAVEPTRSSATRAPTRRHESCPQTHRLPQHAERRVPPQALTQGDPWRAVVVAVVVAVAVARAL